MKIIVGLGNIGKEYEQVYHNAGFMIVDRIAKEFGVSFKNRACESDYAELKTANDKFIIAKPRTYMNASGRAIKSLMKKFDVDIHDVVVICDDIDQPAGKIRTRKSGSAGTHNGLKSVIAETGSNEFVRIKIGIGSQAENQDLADYVLSKMKMTDEQRQGLDKAFYAVYDYISGFSVDEIMTKYNGESGANGKH